jgi:Domain of unknown function (DUF397)
MSSPTGSPESPKSLESQFARLAWRTAQRCDSRDCVQVARAAPDLIAVRDSEDPDCPILLYSARQFSRFIRDAKEGGYDWA